MVAYSFQTQFVAPILSGTKRQTIRADRKRRHRCSEPKPEARHERPNRNGSARKGRVSGSASTAWPRTKKLTIRLPEYKPEPDPPPRSCRVCECERPHWMFSSVGHPDVCNKCLESYSGLPLYSNGHTWRDIAVMRSAKAVIRRLQHGG